MRTALRWLLGGLVAFVVLALLTLGFGIWWNSRDTTLYASGFSEDAFQRLEPGMSIDRVYALLGQPLSTRQEDIPEEWCYGESPLSVRGSAFVVQEVFRESRCVQFNEAGQVIAVTGDGMDAIQHKMTAQEVLGLLGEPTRRGSTVVQTLHYTQSGGEGLFRGRIVALNGSGRVSDVISYQFYD